MEGIKNIIKSIVGFVIYFLLPRKKIVIILSSMRSGSTLLKALLSEAPEIQHLNEVNLYSNSNKYIEYLYYWRKSTGQIVLIKKPSNLANYSTYPDLPNLDPIIIILIRDPIDTILSIKKMNSELGRVVDVEEIIDYWCKTYANLLKWSKKCNTIMYKDLIEKPLEITSNLFHYIGSKRKKGTDTYSLPVSGTWEWGVDDGGKLITNLKVVKKVGPNQSEIIKLIDNKHNFRIYDTFNNYLHI